MADGSIIVDTELDTEGFRAGSKELQSAVKSLNAQVDRLGPSLKKAVSGSTAAMGEFNAKSGNLEQTISDIERKMQILAGARLPTEEYARVCAELDKMSKRFDDLFAKQEKFLATGGKTNSAQWKSMQYDMDMVSDKYHELLRLKSELETSGQAFVFGRDTAQYSALEAGLQRAKNGLQQMSDQAREASGAVAGITGAAKKLPAWLRKAAAATKKLITANHTYKNSFSGVLNQIKRIAPALLAAEGVLGILRKAVNAYMESNQQLASTLNSCWAGIGNLLGPIISRIIGLIASAVAYFTAFLRLLGFTGGAAVKAIGGAGGAAKKETDKLKRQLASFDDLNILSDTSSDDSGGGGGGGAEAALPEKQLPDWAKLMAEQLKAGDWKGAAITLTDKLNEMVENTDWEGAGRKIGYYMNGVLSFLATAITSFNWPALGVGLATAAYQILEAVDWTNLGIVLGAGLLAALGLLYGFVSTFDWAALGKAIADAVMGLWTAIDWSMAAQTISMGIIGVLTTLITAIQNFDWQQIGRDVAAFLTGINWGEIFSNLGKLLWEALKAAFDFLGGMIEGGGLGILASAFSILLGGLAAKVAAGAMWGSVKKALTSSVKNLLKGVVGAEGIGAWGPKILAAGKTMLGTLIGKIGGIAAKVLPAIGGTLTKIVTGIVAAIGGWPTVVIAAAAAGLALLIVWIKNGGADVIHGFFQGIHDAILGVADWIVANIFQPFIDGFKAAFGIHSPSTVMREQGGFIIEGLLLGLTEAWASISKFFRTAVSSIIGALSDCWADIRKEAKSGWKKIQTTVGNSWAELKTNASKKWAEIKSTVEKAWSDMEKNARNANKSIKSDVSSAWSEVKSTISKRMTEAKTAAETAWANMQKKAASTGVAIKSDVASVWADVKKNITTKLTEAKNAADGHWENIKSKAVSVGSEIGRQVSGHWQSIRDSITTNLSNARDLAAPMWDAMKSKAETIGPQIITAVDTGWSGVKGKIVEHLTKAKDEAVAKWESISSDASRINNAIKQSLAGIWADIKTTLTQKAGDIASGITAKFDELKRNAITWGQHICENIADGINRFNYKVANAAKILGQKIKDFVGFSEPDKGPLSNFHTYMPDMIDLMVEGIEGNQHRAVQAVAAMTQGISDEIQNGDYGIKPIVNTRGLSQLKALAASPTYRTPAIAKGELLPYNVTAKLVGLNDGVSDAVWASNEALGQTLVRVIMEAATAVITAIRQSGGNESAVDSETMTTLIINEINRRTRSMGTSPLL
ncbi:MAG: hypothetical protein IKK17_06445 [Oscillospiraceae bacterium]|nr:hypothetical protein [Oscillospiraceae bacterium]